MTNDEKEIRQLLETFITAWKDRKTDHIDELMTSDCEIDYSIFDKGISIDVLKKQLSTLTRIPTYTRFELYNYVCAVGQDKAQNSGFIQGIFVDESGEKSTSFTFDAFIANSLVKVDGKWKMNAMRLELGSSSDNHVRLYSTGVGIDHFAGDVSFIGNWHQLTTEVGFFKGSRIKSIVPEYDAPWYAIKDRVNINGSDLDQIRELVYRYCFSLDLDCLELYDTVFTEDASAVYSDDRKYDKRTVTAMLRFERQGMIGLGHIVYVDSVDFNGDEAVGRIYRAGYVPPHKLHGEDKKLNYVNARYRMEFKKVNGQWRIKKLYYYPGFLVRDYASDVFVCCSGK